MLSPKRMILAAALCALPQLAPAAVIIEAREVGADVVFTMSGTLDLTGMTKVGQGLSEGLIYNTSALTVGAPDNNVDLYSERTNGTRFGTGVGFVYDSAATGTLFGFDRSTIVISRSYVSGDPLTGSSTYAGYSFASLGLVAGIYTSSLPADTITLDIGVDADVPLPAAAPLLLGALGLIGFAARRKG